MFPEAFSRLVRPRVSLMVAAATLFGTLLAHGTLRAGLLAALGSTLLCAGCSALNQLQERRRDALMERTRRRPLAVGTMSPRVGLAWGVALSLAGLGAYAVAGGWPLALLGLAVLGVYNGLYTPLKPVTSLSLLLGGLPGAAPPLAGWMAAGASPADPRILAVCGLFYLWQVPHFWLIAETHRRDYRRAGFAVPSRALPEPFVRPLMGLWMLAYFTAVAGLALTRPQSAAWTFATAAMGLAAVAGFSALGRRRAARISLDAALALSLLALLMG